MEQQGTNAFGRFFNRLGDIIWLNFLWVLCSLPLVTIGAATTAAFSAVFHWNDLDVSNTTRNFFSSLRRNWKQSTLLWLICLLILTVGMNLLRLAATLTGLASNMLYASAVFTLALCAMFLLLLFPIVAYFDVTIKQAFQNAIYLMLRHTYQVLIAAATVAIGVYVTFALAPPVFAVLGGLLIYLNGVCFLALFKKIFALSEKEHYND